MTGRDVTQYWPMHVAETEINERPPYFHSAGSVLRGAEIGDRLWIVTSNDGRMCVVQTFVLSGVDLSRKTAAKRLGVAAGRLMDTDCHVIGSGAPTWPDTPVDVHDVASELRFVSKAKPMLTIKPDGRLDPQTLRAMRTLESESAALLMQRWSSSTGQPDAGPMIDFDPNQADMRKLREASIIYRQGQAKFRQSVLSAYKNRCCISGFDVADALDAAHIVPYLGEHSNKVANGLLLRSDLHALFD